MAPLEENLKVVPLGTVGVDSGMLVVADPCNVLDEVTYASLVEGIEGWAHEVPYPAGHLGLGVAIRTPHGDGLYPVSLVMRVGLPVELRVRLVEEGE